MMSLCLGLDLSQETVGPPSVRYQPETGEYLSREHTPNDGSCHRFYWRCEIKHRVLLNAKGQLAEAHHRLTLRQAR